MEVYTAPTEACLTDYPKQDRPAGFNSFGESTLDFAPVFAGGDIVDSRGARQTVLLPDDVDGDGARSSVDQREDAVSVTHQPQPDFGAVVLPAQFARLVPSLRPEGADAGLCTTVLGCRTALHEAERQVQQGRQRLQFAETELLSSYLVAVVVGPLQASSVRHVDGVPLRTWATEKRVHLTAFAQDVAAAVLPRLSEYFGLPYAFGKVDQVGVPEFEAGAMENAGLITYRETALLLDPQTASLPVQKRVAEVITLTPRA